MYWVGRVPASRSPMQPSAGFLQPTRYQVPTIDCGRAAQASEPAPTVRTVPRGLRDHGYVPTSPSAHAGAFAGVVSWSAEPSTFNNDETQPTPCPEPDTQI